jgi:hypothetical protein
VSRTACRPGAAAREHLQVLQDGRLCGEEAANDFLAPLPVDPRIGLTADDFVLLTDRAEESG